MSPADAVAFQDQMNDNYCWGCGADNPHGLQLKSHWDGDTAVAEWRPSPVHAAGPRHILNGGIIATLLDCHGICTAIAARYRVEKREIGSLPDLWCATASMTVEYLRPAPLEAPVLMTAQIVGAEDRVTTVQCELESDGKPRARASVRAVQVPDSWRHGTSPERLIQTLRRYADFCL